MFGCLDTLAGKVSKIVLDAKGFVQYFIKNVIYFTTTAGALKSLCKQSANWIVQLFKLGG